MQVSTAIAPPEGSDTARLIRDALRVEARAAYGCVDWYLYDAALAEEKEHAESGSPRGAPAQPADRGAAR